MPKDSPKQIFPKWLNTIRPQVALGLAVGPLYLVALIYYAFSPTATMSGYMPDQPVEYSHAVHVGDLGIDCRYCHNTVEDAAMAAIPPTEVCMNCHATIRTTSEKLAPIRESFQSGLSVNWVRVHDLPDFVFFNHSAHVTRGVGCEECHGRVDRMDKVYQQERLSMGWCLECHRDPDAHLRPPALATAMGFTTDEDRSVLGEQLRHARNIDPSLDCSTCHR